MNIEKKRSQEFPRKASKRVKHAIRKESSEMNTGWLKTLKGLEVLDGPSKKSYEDVRWDIRPPLFTEIQATALFSSLEREPFYNGAAVWCVFESLLTMPFVNRLLGSGKQVYRVLCGQGILVDAAGISWEINRIITGGLRPADAMVLPCDDSDDSGGIHTRDRVAVKNLRILRASGFVDHYTVKLAVHTDKPHLKRFEINYHALDENLGPANFVATPDGGLKPMRRPRQEMRPAVKPVQTQFIAPLHCAPPLAMVRGLGMKPYQN